MIRKAASIFSILTALAVPASHATAHHNVPAKPHHVAMAKLVCTETDGSGKQAFPCYSMEGFTINSTHKPCVYNAATEMDGDKYWNGTKGVTFTHTYPNGKVVKTCAL